MREARRSLGLSSEGMARLISASGYQMSGKTWERWEDKGHLHPRARKAFVAATGIKLIEPDPLEVRLDGSTSEQAFVAAAELLGQAGQEVALALAELRDLLARQDRVVDEMRELVSALQHSADSKP